MSATEGLSRKRRLLRAAMFVVLGAAALSAVAFILRAQPVVEQFLDAYPGAVNSNPDAPVGIPVWLSVTHFLNMLFLLLIIRTGMSIRSKKRPPAFVTPRVGLLGQKPRRVGINVWLHNTVDVLWILTGIVYVTLLFATGQWMRIVPTTWEVIPNALSAALQYLTFTAPAENPWVSYNSLQMLAYFGVVFVLAPLAIVTGIRLSSLWPMDTPRLNRAIPERPIRRLHNLVLFLFLAFIAVHIALVLFTGVQHNLNVMFASSDDAGWLGTIIFVGSLAVLAAVWFALTPGTQKRLASLTGTVQ